MPTVRVTGYFASSKKRQAGKLVDTFKLLVEEIIKPTGAEVRTLSVFNGVAAVDITSNEGAETLLAELKQLDGVAVEKVSSLVGLRADIEARATAQEKKKPQP